MNKYRICDILQYNGIADLSFDESVILSKKAQNDVKVTWLLGHIVGMHDCVVVSTKGYENAKKMDYKISESLILDCTMHDIDLNQCICLNIHSIRFSNNNSIIINGNTNKIMNDRRSNIFQLYDVKFDIYSCEENNGKNLFCIPF